MYRYSKYSLTFELFSSLCKQQQPNNNLKKWFSYRLTNTIIISIVIAKRDIIVTVDEIAISVAVDAFLVPKINVIILQNFNISQTCNCSVLFYFQNSYWLQLIYHSNPLHELTLSMCHCGILKYVMNQL